ncbi:AAA family ATPase [Qipengyuania sp. 1NDH17]|uniref:AAA family ATPase n=1 Tax=Qipengyuania polymorpha TaxID=2867234 RepID=A0ABS7IW16_9SPHN|nr:AAA family ATPase [Qipengyuania polymorpha]MBX7457483.1 AAA family ATPase [Qipengyuania polymorpha]
MYEDFYGFSERPFQLTPDPSFYFESVTHKKALSYLGYGLNQGEGFIVITGEVGAGKSTLVGHLRNRLDWNSVTVGEVVTSALGSDEMIGMAAHSFGLEVDAGDKAGALSAIELFLQDEARAGRKVLLIIDEAQNLTVGALEELRMLSNFHLGAKPLLQMLLLGQPEFRQLLSEWDQLEQLRQRVIASHHLEAMQPNEIEPYVMHRLEHVGYKLCPGFEGDVWSLIHRESRGIPRLVNRIMSRVLMKGAMEEREIIGEDLVRAVIDEMNGRAVETAPAAPVKKHAPQPLPVTPPVEEPVASEPADEAALLDAQIEAIEKAFAQRDKAISSLRKEMANLAQSASSEPSGDVEERLAAIEMRLEEQERSLRHVLTMMIDYFESSATRNAA